MGLSWSKRDGIRASEWPVFLFVFVMQGQSGGRRVGSTISCFHHFFDRLRRQRLALKTHTTHCRMSTDSVSTTLSMAPQKTSISRTSFCVRSSPSPWGPRVLGSASQLPCLACAVTPWTGPPAIYAPGRSLGINAARAIQRELVCPGLSRPPVHREREGRKQEEDDEGEVENGLLTACPGPWFWNARVWDASFVWITTAHQHYRMSDELFSLRTDSVALQRLIEKGHSLK